MMEVRRRWGKGRRPFWPTGLAAVASMSKTVAWVNSVVGRVRQVTAPWRRRGLDLLYPPLCVYCDGELVGSEGDLGLCVGCQRRLAPEPWAACRHCAAPSEEGATPSARCHLCRRARFRFDSVVALGVYRDHLASAILRIKHPQGEPLAAALGRLLAARRLPALQSLQADVVVPVPMHWWQRLIRKVNAPDILAARVGGALGVKVPARLLRRVRISQPQKRLPPSQRYGNVAGAFAAAASGALKGARVLLVDDVLTTGATCNAAARVLLRGGASKVFVAVLGRGIGEGLS